MAREVEEGARKVGEGSNEVEEGSNEVEEGAREVKEGAREAEEGSREVKEGANEVEERAREVEEGARETEEGGGVNIDRVRDGQFWPATKCGSRNMWMCFFYCILFYHITNITYELLLLKFCRYCHFQLNYNNIYFKRFFCKNICAILWTNFFI